MYHSVNAPLKWPLKGWLACCGLLKSCKLGCKVIYVRCINCSYYNVAKGIRLLDKKSIFVCTGKNHAFERYIPLNQISSCAMIAQQRTLSDWADFQCIVIFVWCTYYDVFGMPCVNNNWIPFIQNFPSCPFFGNLLVTCFKTFLSRVVLRVALISPQHLLAPTNGHMLLLSAYALFFQTNHSVKKKFMIICCLTLYLIMDSFIWFDTMKWQWRIQRGFQGVRLNPLPNRVFFNILWKWNNLVSLRPNYFIFMGYLRKMR